MKHEQTMQIGVVAERTELSVTTLRHYDEVGLVTPSARSEGGFRLYTEDDVQRVLVIRRMKPLEFTRAEMRELLDALDTLSDEDAPETDAAAASTVLGACRDRLEDAAARLRKRLDYAAELDEILERISQNPSHRVPVPRDQRVIPKDQTNPV